jgi:basic amino acid/polyamine antiporter, APA family
VSVPSSNVGFFKSLFRTKGLDGILKAQENQEHKLDRTLSAFDLVVFGVGAMVGAGIFVLTGSAAADGAGPALTVSFILTGILCAFCALCYSEFATMAPISGSAYSYAFSTMGEIVAWIIGWALVLEYAVGNMAVAVGWAGSVKELLHSKLHFAMPAWFTSNTIETMGLHEKIAHPDLVLYSVPFHLPGAPEAQQLLIQKAFNFPPMLIVLLVTALLVRGVSENAKQAAVMVFIKTGVILLFIACGLYFLFFGHWDLLMKNWFAHGWQTFAPKGWDGIFTGASTIFFAYLGFDAVACSAEETKNPQRDVPIGIIGSLAICTVLYILVTIVITGVVPLHLINKEAAVVSTMGMMGLPGADIIVSLGAIAGLTSVLMVFQMAGVRIYYAIARDGLLPKKMAEIHPKYATPYFNTIFSGVFVALGSGLLPITMLAHMCNIGTLAAFLVVCLGVLILRFTDPKRHRPFKTPLGITIPILGIAGCIAVMSFLPADTWAITVLWFMLGLVLYFSYGFWHSNLAPKQQAKALLEQAHRAELLDVSVNQPALSLAD